MSHLRGKFCKKQERFLKRHFFNQRTSLLQNWPIRWGQINETCGLFNCNISEANFAKSKSVFEMTTIFIFYQRTSLLPNWPLRWDT